MRDQYGQEIPTRDALGPQGQPFVIRERDDDDDGELRPVGVLVIANDPTNGGLILGLRPYTDDDEIAELPGGEQDTGDDEPFVTEPEQPTTEPERVEPDAAPVDHQADDDDGPSLPNMTGGRAPAAG